MQFKERRQVLDAACHRVGQPAIEHDERGDAVVTHCRGCGEIAAERKAEQTDATGTVGTHQHRGDGG
jgi:hypothetical protein